MKYNFWYRKKILITGIDGFVGSNLAKKLVKLDAKVYGIRLRPELYEKYNPIPSRKDAEEIEEMLGKELRKKGVGVWYN